MDFSDSKPFPHGRLGKIEFWLEEKTSFADLSSLLHPSAPWTNNRPHIEDQPCNEQLLRQDPWPVTTFRGFTGTFMVPHVEPTLEVRFDLPKFQEQRGSGKMLGHVLKLL